MSQGCPREGWEDLSKDEGEPLHFCGEGTTVKVELQGSRGERDSPGDPVGGSGVE